VRLQVVDMSERTVTFAAMAAKPVAVPREKLMAPPKKTLRAIGRADVPIANVPMPRIRPSPAEFEAHEYEVEAENDGEHVNSQALG